MIGLIVGVHGEELVGGNLVAARRGLSSADTWEVRPQQIVTDRVVQERAAAGLGVRLNRREDRRQRGALGGSITREDDCEYVHVTVHLRHNRFEVGDGAVRIGREVEHGEIVLSGNAEVLHGGVVDLPDANSTACRVGTR